MATNEKIMDESGIFACYHAVEVFALRVALNHSSNTKQMASEQKVDENQPEKGNDNLVANTGVSSGFTGMVYEQYRKAKENAEAYPYVWSSYLIVYGGFGLWVAYRYRKLRNTEDRVKALQEKLRILRQEREPTTSSAASTKKITSSNEESTK
ncbi:unnamed protein product [Lactuca virosa]|uniref:Transmembrane protein n=1 Tax=Lactuca virosa TaxID=75947 RepID=A0AAU9MI32_9ASTR|nr:unnamed protein product [Lactuca virosa]